MEQGALRRGSNGGDTGCRKARVHFYQQHKAETADRVTRGSEDIVTIEQVCWMHSWCKLRQARCEAVV